MRPECFLRPMAQVRWSSTSAPTTTVAFVLDQLVKYVTLPPIPPPLNEDCREILGRDWAVFLTHLRGVYSGALLHSLGVYGDDETTKTMVLLDFLATWNECFFMARGAQFALVQKDDRVEIPSSAIHLTSYTPSVDEQAVTLTEDTIANVSPCVEVVEQPSQELGIHTDTNIDIQLPLSETMDDGTPTGTAPLTVHGPYEFTVLRCFDELPSPHTSFFRPPETGVPWPMPPSKVLDLSPNGESSERPQMPSILRRFDVCRKDWDLVADHVSQALNNTIPIINLGDAPRSDALRELIVSDIIQCWNTFFFNKRRLELVVQEDEDDDMPWIHAADSATPSPRSLVLQIYQSDTASVISFGDSDSEASFGPATRRELSAGLYTPFSIDPNTPHQEEGEDEAYYSADDEAQCRNLEVSEDRHNHRNNASPDLGQSPAPSNILCLTPDADVGSSRRPAMSLSSSVSSLGNSRSRRRRQSGAPQTRNSSRFIPPITTTSLTKRDVGSVSPSAHGSTVYPSPTSPSSYWRGKDYRRDSADSRTVVSGRVPGTPIEPPPLPKVWEWNV